ncbi:S-layer homology domain-containing protein [Planococcus sp. SE5232]|uniref:S-layer homology domain-containing protein n=1 Tax=unclassified Planococcus (in: firmicutes) TaxID=2662419 RepID=UPI003D6A3A2D
MKKMGKVAMFFLALLLIVPPALAAPDLSEQHTFYEEINYLMERDVITGYPDGTVRPDAVVTRAEAAIMIGRLKDLDGTQRETKFPDVTANQRASGYIASAEEAGYVSGFTDGTFRPYAAITRGDMAIIVDRLFSLGLTAQVDFTDVSQNMRAYEAISRILAGNITIGYPDNTYRPSASVTRGQFAAFLGRGLEPAFKNKAAIPVSFMKDKTKTYIYQTPEGIERHSYAYVPDRSGREYGFMWSVVSDIGTGEALYGEIETHRTFGLQFIPQDIYVLDLQYPVRLGDSFTDENNQVFTVTAVGQTVTTDYGTFEDVVEVTVNGYQHYYAEGHARIRVDNPQGDTVNQLIGME